MTDVALAAVPDPEPDPEDSTVVVDFDLGGPFSLREVDLIENLSGVPLPRWFDGETFEGALRQAIVFVHASRESDDVTLADAGEVKLRTPTPDTR